MINHILLVCSFGDTVTKRYLFPETDDRNVFRCLIRLNGLYINSNNEDFDQEDIQWLRKALSEGSDFESKYKVDDDMKCAALITHTSVVTWLE